MKTLLILLLSVIPLLSAPMYVGNHVGQGSGLSNVVAATIDVADTNTLHRGTTNQWSRYISGHIPRYYGPTISNAGVPLLYNNGYGSIDLQSEFSQNTATFVASNSCGGVNCSILGGEGNGIWQTQAGFDAHGFNTVNSTISAGYYNYIINGSECFIGGGAANYIGPSNPSSPENIDDCYIGYGIGCAIVDAIDACIGYGMVSTNASGGGSGVITGNGSIVNGFGNAMNSGWAIISGYQNKIWQGGSFHVSGAWNYITNSPESFTLSPGYSYIKDAYYSGAIGWNLTNNGTHGKLMIGYGTNSLNIYSNGAVEINRGLTIQGGTSTNKSQMTIEASNPFPLFMTPYTNRNQQATLTLSLTSGGVIGFGDIAVAYLLVDQNHDGTYEETLNRVGTRDSTSAVYLQLIRNLQPNARFMISNHVEELGELTLNNSIIDYR